MFSMGPTPHGRVHRNAAKDDVRRQTCVHTHALKASRYAMYPVIAALL